MKKSIPVEISEANFYTKIGKLGSGERGANCRNRLATDILVKSQERVRPQATDFQKISVINYN